MRERIKKVKQIGCFNCSHTYKTLPYKTVLYNDFGGYVVLKDGKCFYACDREETPKILSEIEKEARKDPDHEWVVDLQRALRSAVYERQGKTWYLVEQGMGFA